MNSMITCNLRVIFMMQTNFLSIGFLMKNKKQILKNNSLKKKKKLLNNEWRIFSILNIYLNYYAVQIKMNNSSTTQQVDYFLPILAYYSLFLVVYGTLGNCVTAFVCCRKKLRQTPLFVFLAFKAVLDTVPLYLWNLNPFLFYKYDRNLGDLGGLWSCKLVLFLMGVSEGPSVYIMVRLVFLLINLLMTDVF